MKRWGVSLFLITLLTACVGAGPTATPTSVPPALASTPVGLTPPSLSTALAPSATMPTATPANGAALVERAVSIALINYVDPLDSGPLYLAAYEATVTALTKMGATDVGAAPPTFANDSTADAATFAAAYLALVSPHSSLDQTMLAYAAVRGIASKIDECHTRFLDPEVYRREIVDPTYAGIGIITGRKPATIVEVFPGSPAARGGLRPGDVFLSIDGVDVSAQDADGLRPFIVGPEGTTVALTVRRPGESAPRAFTVTRAKITPPDLKTEVRTSPSGAKVGYIKLYNFPESVGVADDLRKALTMFEQAGVTEWVLDLRWNTGGSIRTLVRIASLFLSGGRDLGYRVTRAGPATFTTDGKVTFEPHHPLAILINERSESSSEILASALQDYGVARIFGTRSAGCVGVGTLYQLADGSALEVTTARIMSPHRRAINGVGVTPDEVIQPGPDDSEGSESPTPDAVLRWLASQQ